MLRYPSSIYMPNLPFPLVSFPPIQLRTHLPSTYPTPFTFRHLPLSAPLSTQTPRPKDHRAEIFAAT